MERSRERKTGAYPDSDSSGGHQQMDTGAVGGELTGDSLLQGQGSVAGPPKSVHKERSLSRIPSVSTELAKKLDSFAIANESRISSDEVFVEQDTPIHPAGGHGLGMSATHSQGLTFPPAYGVVRAGKGKKLNQCTLSGLKGQERKSSEWGGFPKPGMQIKGDERAFSAQNYHSVEKGLNISLSISKTETGTVDGMQCLLAMIRSL